MILAEKRLRKIIRESLNRLITEEYLDNVYSSENFQRWFAGSKIVDENGKPLLLGHATRNFGFKKFNTTFIHLSSINDASYFSGGNKRLFKYKNTLNRLSNEELVKLFNDYFAFDESDKYYELTNDKIQEILSTYQQEINKCKDPEYIERIKHFGLDAEEEISTLQTALTNFINITKKYENKLFYRNFRHGLPRLTPCGHRTDKKAFDLWLKGNFTTASSLKKNILDRMFDKDEYMGKGGTYVLCARILNPLHIDCNGNSWDSIYVRPDSCPIYDELFDMYCKNGWNTHHCNKGSWFAMDNETIAYCAKQCGFDGVVFHNIREGFNGNVRMNETYIVFSTKQLKSPFENNGEFGDVEHLFK